MQSELSSTMLCSLFGISFTSLVFSRPFELDIYIFCNEDSLYIQEGPPVHIQR